MSWIVSIHQLYKLPFYLIYNTIPLLGSSNRFAKSISLDKILNCVFQSINSSPK